MTYLIYSYFLWHYTEALGDFLKVARNFLWFIYHFFSIPVLSKTLFSPWQKLDEPYRKGWSIGNFFETFVVNLLMRIVGFFIRGCVILFGLIVLAILFVLEAAAFIVWLLLPLIALLLFISGIHLIVK